MTQHVPVVPTFKKLVQARFIQLCEIASAESAEKQSRLHLLLRSSWVRDTYHHKMAAAVQSSLSTSALTAKAVGPCRRSRASAFKASLQKVQMQPSDVLHLVISKYGLLVEGEANAMDVCSPRHLIFVTQKSTLPIMCSTHNNTNACNLTSRVFSSADF